MTTAYYSAVLDHPLETVWSLIRDFNNYPAYIEGVSESMIEDDQRGDEVGAIRRFCYLGNWVRQRLAAHSDASHLLTYAGIEPLPFPAQFAEARSPVRYEGTMRLRAIVEGNRTFTNGRWNWIRNRRMPNAGTRCFSPGFRTGPIRWQERWHAARPELPGWSSPAKAGDPVCRGLSDQSRASLEYWIARSKPGDDTRVR